MDLLSSGNLATIVQRSPQRIVKELEAKGIEPSMRLNGVPYFESDKAIAALRVGGIEQRAGRPQRNGKGQL